MEWTPQKVSVDLADFSRPQLLQALIDADWLSKAEAQAIKQRAERKEKNAPINSLIPAVDEEQLVEALEWAQRQRRDEALHHLELALGREWYGRLTGGVH
jgi:hypothetical protein